MFNSMKAESVLWDRLDARLREQLLACEARCPTMVTMEQEYAELKKRKLAHEKEMDSIAAAFGAKSNTTDSSLEARRRAESLQAMARQKYSDAQLLANRNLENRCREKAGLPKWGSPEDQQNSPTVFTREKRAIYQACVAEGPAASDASSNNLARTHFDAMKACAAFYNPGVGEFRQQAYDGCMNERDAATLQCTAERRAAGKKGVCLGEPPAADVLVKAADANGADCSAVTKAVDDALQSLPRNVVKRTAAPAGACSYTVQDTGFPNTPIGTITVALHRGADATPLSAYKRPAPFLWPSESLPGLGQIADFQFSADSPYQLGHFVLYRHERLVLDITFSHWGSITNREKSAAARINK